MLEAPTVNPSTPHSAAGSGRCSTHSLRNALIPSPAMAAAPSLRGADLDTCLWLSLGGRPCQSGRGVVERGGVRGG